MVRSLWLNGLSIIKKIILTTWLSVLDFFTITKSAIKLQTEIGRTPKNKICQHLTTRKTVKCHLCILHRWLVRTSQLRHNLHSFNCLKQTKPPNRHLQQDSSCQVCQRYIIQKRPNSYQLSPTMHYCVPPLDDLIPILSPFPHTSYPTHMFSHFRTYNAL